MSRKLEQEVKFYLNDLKAFEKRLIASGAQPQTGAHALKSTCDLTHPTGA